MSLLSAICFKLDFKNDFYPNITEDDPEIAENYRPTCITGESLKFLRNYYTNKSMNTKNLITC